jgi:hypothetical protein
MTFYRNIALSFYHNIACQNCSSDKGLRETITKYDMIKNLQCIPRILTNLVMVVLFKAQANFYYCPIASSQNNAWFKNGKGQAEIIVSIQ